MQPIQRNFLIPLSSPIRFEKDVNVSKLWKLAENLIDFGGKGYRVVSLSLDGRLVALEDPKQKQSFSSFASTVLKICVLALTYMSVIGGIAHLGLIIYNRKNYAAKNTAVLGSVDGHAACLRGKELDTPEKILLQFKKDCQRDMNLTLNGQLIQKPDQNDNENEKPYDLSDFPAYGQNGIDETLFEKIGLFSQQGTRADGCEYIRENFHNRIGINGQTKGKITYTVVDLTNEKDDLILKVKFPITVYDEEKFGQGHKVKKADAIFTKKINLTNDNVPVTISLSEYKLV